MISGSIVAILTPMHEDGSLDFNRFRSLIDFHVAEGTDGIVVVDDFFSPRYPANTTEVIRYLEKNPFHFRLLAVGFNKGYLCRPESLPFYMDYMASGMSKAMSHYGAVCTIFKTTGPWDTDAVGITKYVQDAGDIAGPDDEPQSWEMIRKRPVWGPLRHLRNGWRMLTGR